LLPGCTNRPEIPPTCKSCMKMLQLYGRLQ